MTRFLVGLVLTLALGVMGCSETSGTGGSGAVGGEGGAAGNGGAAGEAGNGGGPVESCEGVESVVPCEGPGERSWCVNEICMTWDCAEAEEWAYCLAPAEKAFFIGLCQADTCVRECAVLEEGDGCLMLLAGLDVGFCQEGFCRFRCVSDADCDDSDDCTLDRCLVDGACKHFQQPDGTSCSHPPAGVTGICESGVCEGLVLGSP